MSSWLSWFRPDALLKYLSPMSDAWLADIKRKPTFTTED